MRFVKKYQRFYCTSCKKYAKKGLKPPVSYPVEVEIDPDDPEANDDRVILRAMDGSFEQILSIVEDGVEETEGWTKLVFQKVPVGKKYSIQVDTGEEQYYLCKNHLIGEEV